MVELRPGARPVLRPGLRILERDERLLQLGLDPASGVVLSRAEVEPTLRAVASGRVRTGADPDVVAALAAEGLIVDARVVFRPGPLDAAARALIVASRAEADRALDAREGFRVCLPEEDHLEIGPLLQRCGFAVRTDLGAPAEVTVLAGFGEADREVVDRLVREDRSHLVVRVGEGAVTVGPFVTHGGACLRCIDAHRTEADPRWPTLVAGAAGGGPVRADGVPEPVDAALRALAAGWAAREVASYAEGARPATWSATVRIPPDLAGLESVTWLRHPECGCSWDAGPAATLGA